MSLRRSFNYEVDLDYVELVTPDGHKQWLTRGDELPEWVQPSVIKELLARRALVEFEVLRNG
jgi:hypothetical protein